MSRCSFIFFRDRRHVYLFRLLRDSMIDSYVNSDRWRIETDYRYVHRTLMICKSNDHFWSYTDNMNQTDVILDIDSLEIDSWRRSPKYCLRTYMRSSWVVVYRISSSWKIPKEMTKSADLKNSDSLSLSEYSSLMSCIIFEDYSVNDRMISIVETLIHHAWFL